MPFGIPGWKNLVLELLFDQTEAATRLQGLLPHYRRALASWLTDYFDYDPVILARVVKTDMRRKARGVPAFAEQRFLDGVRHHLYRGYEQMKAPGRARSRPAVTALDACADLIARTTATRGVAAVVTFNFDDLLERALDRRRVRYCVVTDESRVVDRGIPIVHPHGFLAQQGHNEERPANIVFTEDDYHRLTDSVFHWALTTILAHLRSHTALFVGLSMSDPNLRRLLDAAHPAGGAPVHWQIQKRHEIRDQERAVVRDSVQRRAMKYAELLGEGNAEAPDPVVKDDAQLSDAINAILRQADSYDRELFESMGVKTIWLQRFEDIPPLLRLISTRS